MYLDLLQVFELVVRVRCKRVERVLSVRLSVLCDLVEVVLRDGAALRGGQSGESVAGAE